MYFKCTFNRSQYVLRASYKACWFIFYELKVNLMLKYGHLSLVFQLSGTVHYNHRFGCQKCSIQGTFISSRMSFHRLPDFYANRQRYLRTDEQFRNKFQPNHHREFSILEELIGINMIDSFVVADSLHLLDLGIMKRYVL